MKLEGIPRLPKYKLSQQPIIIGNYTVPGSEAHQFLNVYFNGGYNNEIYNEWKYSLMIEEYDWTNRLISGYPNNWRVVPAMPIDDYINSDSAPEDKKVLLTPIGYQIGILRRLAHFNPMFKLGGSNDLESFQAENYEKDASYYLPKRGGSFIQNNPLRTNRTIIINYKPDNPPKDAVRIKAPFGDFVNRFKSRLDQHNISLYNFGEFTGDIMFPNITISRPALVLPFLHRQHKSTRVIINNASTYVKEYLVSVDDCMVGGDLLYITMFNGDHYTGVEDTFNPDTGVLIKRKPFLSPSTIANSIALVNKMKKSFNSIEIHTISFPDSGGVPSIAQLPNALSELKEVCQSQTIAEGYFFAKDIYPVFRDRAITIIDTWINEHFGSK